MRNAGDFFLYIQTLPRELMVGSWMIVDLGIQQGRRQMLLVLAGTDVIWYVMTLLSRDYHIPGLIGTEKIIGSLILLKKNQNHHQCHYWLHHCYHHYYSLLVLLSELPRLSSSVLPVDLVVAFNILRWYSIASHNVAIMVFSAIIAFDKVLTFFNPLPDVSALIAHFLLDSILIFFSHFSISIMDCWICCTISCGWNGSWPVSPAVRKMLRSSLVASMTSCHPWFIFSKTFLRPFLFDMILTYLTYFLARLCIPGEFLGIPLGFPFRPPKKGNSGSSEEGNQ